LFTPSNPHKYFAQVFGSGNNAKSFLFNILGTVFKEWIAMPDPSHFIIQKGHSNANGATPWIIGLMGRHIAVTEEPNTDTPGGAVYLDGNQLKRFRGDNVITGRLLNKNNVTFKPTFTVWICTNKLIEITPHDQAISDSFVSYRLPSVFLGATKLAEAKSGGGQNANDEFLYLKDDSLKAKFERRSYKMALLYVLAGFFRRYTDRGRFTDEPSKFVLAKSVYEQAVAPTLHELFYRLFTVEPLPLTFMMPRTTQKEILATLEANGFPGRQNKELTVFLTEKFLIRHRKAKNIPSWVGIKYSPTVEDGAEADTDGGGELEGGGGGAGLEGGGGGVELEGGGGGARLEGVGGGI
jgi:hypothetical protein